MKDISLWPDIVIGKFYRRFSIMISYRAYINGGNEPAVTQELKVVTFTAGPGTALQRPWPAF